MIGQSIASKGSMKYGAFGIKTNGTYTFYDTLGKAIESSTYGTVIDMFQDYTELNPITITPINGIIINMQGHTYTLESKSYTNAMKVGAEVSFSMFNGVVKRTKGLFDITSSVTLHATSSGTVNCIGVRFENDNGVSFYGSANIIGATFISNSNTIDYGFLQMGGDLSNCTIQSKYHNRMSFGSAYNCTFKSTSGYALNNWGANIFGCTVLAYGNVAVYDYQSALNKYSNCFFYSATSQAIASGYNSVYSNCSAHSDGYIAVGFHGRYKNCSFYSSVSNACFGANGTFENCTFEANTAITVRNASDGNFENCKVRCLWNHPSAHGFYLFNDTVNGVKIINCVIEVANKGANCINSTIHISNKAYYAGNMYIGSLVPVTSINGNMQTNPTDNFGNILIN